MWIGEVLLIVGLCLCSDDVSEKLNFVNIEVDDETGKEIKNIPVKIKEVLFSRLLAGIREAEKNQFNLTENQRKKEENEKSRYKKLLEINKNLNVEYNEETIHIGSDTNLFKIIYNNLENIKKISCEKTGVFENIAIYYDEKKGIYTDFWGILQFEKEDDGFIDTTGHFLGVLKSGWEDLLRSSRIGLIGFAIDISTTVDMDYKYSYIAKRLISELSKEKKEAISDFIRSNISIGPAEYLILNEKYPIRPQSQAVVCVCKESTCKKGCYEIRKIGLSRLL